MIKAKIRNEALEWFDNLDKESKVSIIIKSYIYFLRCKK